MHHKTLLASCAAALALGLAPAYAQTGAAGTGSAGGGTAAGSTTAPRAQPGAGTRNTETRKDDKLARGDRKFVEEAAGSGLFEVQAAQLAATKATDDQVKAFARMLVDDHTKANNELTQLANAKKVELPAAPPRGKRNDIEKLGKRSGAEFDREFVREVGIKAHEKDIKEFEKASKDLKDSELKAFAEKTLPKLREHLAAAQKLPQADGKGGMEAARNDSGGSAARSQQRMGNTGGGAATGSPPNAGANKSGT